MGIHLQEPVHHPLYDQWVELNTFDMLFLNEIVLNSWFHRIETIEKNENVRITVYRRANIRLPYFQSRLWKEKINWFPQLLFNIFSHFWKWLQANPNIIIIPGTAPIEIAPMQNTNAVNNFICLHYWFSVELFQNVFTDWINFAFSMKMNRT